MQKKDVIKLHKPQTKRTNFHRGNLFAEDAQRRLKGWENLSSWKACIKRRVQAENWRDAQKNLEDAFEKSPFEVVADIFFSSISMVASVIIERQFSRRYIFNLEIR